jgi:DnaJ-class molecular chaperone
VLEGFVENDEDEDPFEEEDVEVPCPKCCGSGLTIEGWDCWYCDGDGYLEF